MPTSIHSVTFWLNAFLPRDIIGATTTLREGPQMGLTAISGPLCCLTDQRNFSNNIHARSRMHSQVTIDLSDSPPTMTQNQRCDMTLECDCKSGEVKRQRRADTARMKFSLAAVEPTVTIHMDCIASNPCSSASWAFGDIAYKGLIVIDPSERSITIDLMIGLFPAFEAYAAINEGRGATLFHYAPPAGMTAARTPTGATRPIRARLEDRDGDGFFELPTLGVL